jgi:ribosomal protein S18 acetylase RimI-like enzyme
MASGDAAELPEAERRLPALYMLWPHERGTPAAPALPAGYALRAVASEHLDAARPVVEMDGLLGDAQWAAFRNQVVPDGLFLAEGPGSAGPVGTASAVHNPAATRFYFPGGGELGYLTVAPGHRGRGLGAALVAAAVRRLHQGGYRHVFLGVQGWRLPAVRCYLRAGFRPFLHAPALAVRWRSVFAALGREPHEADWPTRLPDPPA